MKRAINQASHFSPFLAEKVVTTRRTFLLSFDLSERKKEQYSPKYHFSPHRSRCSQTINWYLLQLLKILMRCSSEEI